MSRLSASDRIGVAVIGVGLMGRRHAEHAAGGAGDTRLVAVYDAAADVARRVAADLDAVAAASVDELVARADIRVVVIASPDRFHADHAVAALEAGKDVLLEKPMALTLADCDRVVEAARRAGTRLQIGFMRRYDGAHAEAHRIVRSGALGAPLLYAGSSRDRDPARVPPALDVAEVLLGSAIHDLDSARWLLGDEVVRVTTVAAARPGAEPGAVPGATLTTLELAQGTLASAETYRGAHYAYDIRCEIVCERATLMIGDQPAPGSAPRLIVRMAEGAAVARGDPGWLARFEDAYAAELADFVGGAREGRLPAITAADGKAAVAIALTGVASFASGRRERVLWSPAP